MIRDPVRRHVKLPECRSRFLMRACPWRRPTLLTAVLTAVLTMASMALRPAIAEPGAKSTAMRPPPRAPLLALVRPVVAPLPAAVTNNAVARLCRKGRPVLVSFMGLGAAKRWRDITRAAHAYEFGQGKWRRLPDVPVPQGRIAATAVGIGGTALLFGGYSVATDGHEVSEPEVFRFDIETNRWTMRAPMPLPVDDSVSGVLDERYVYLVSGWHDDGNVPDVQIYDSHEDRWTKATPFPGRPVFGHAGGLVGRTLVVIDGVAVVGRDEQGRRRFRLVRQAWRGDIDPDDPRRIRWRRIADHPGPPVYRAGATALPENGWVLFAGGGLRAYNYDGIGYDGVPAEASARVFAYDVKSDRWYDLGRMAQPSMDHRALIAGKRGFHLVGGMDADRKVRRQVTGFILPDASPSPCRTGG
ncbi:MAG: galactose oxidase [Alphaproteobacteria bacterium]|nr:MAG: galactose oxidase [Alphaproteobacteria bacterium]